MPFCCVVGCGSRSQRDAVRFFRIPAERQFKHKVLINKLSAERRQKWLNAIKRIDLTPEKIKYSFVCSKHFVSGEPSALEETTNPDWLPTLNMGSGSTSASQGEKKMEKYTRWKKMVEVKSNIPSTSCNAAVEDVVMDNEDVEMEDEKSDLHKNEKNEQTELTMEEISRTCIEHSSCAEIEKKLLRLCLTVRSLENDDKKTKFYTGLENFKVVNLLISILSPFIQVHGNTILPAAEQILLTLVKLRLNLSFHDLSYRFGISQFVCSTYFKNIIRIMYLRLKKFVFWPSREILKKTMPQCFKECFGEKITVIIDCFELFSEVPANLLAKAQSWSSYKHHNTIKFLIGITPQGTVCYISEGWGGRVSDKCITQNSSFLNNLQPNDVVLADRGFLIKEFVEVFHSKVITPAFTRGKEQMHPVDLEETRSIAHVRIHVERVIGVIRQKFQILADKVPISLLNTGEVAILDEIVFVCSALFNMCPPIIKE